MPPPFPRPFDQFNAVDFKYAPELPSALMNVSFKTSPREKVGIVGRTGSGKSTLGQALFRIVELHGGAVTVDGVNVATVPLDTLRSRIAVIPQVSQGTRSEGVSLASLWCLLNACCTLLPVASFAHTGRRCISCALALADADAVFG